MILTHNYYRLLSTIIVLTIISGGGLISLSQAQGGDTSTFFPPYPNCRFGVTIGGHFTSFDPDEVRNLNAGWYVNWRTNSSQGAPPGIEYVNIVRLHQHLGSYISTPFEAELLVEVAAKPGQTWFIANEPDSIWQDALWPAIYVNAYHDLYYLIKGIDPTAKVGIGAIVQPTPLRFQYLNIVWNTYRATYHEDMPVDIWNIHSFILREISGSHPQANNGNPKYEVWGAYIPPGPEFTGVQEGILYDRRDMDDVDIFWERIVDFRAWMAQHGQRNKPLVITEYGLLFPEDFTDEDGIYFSQSRVGDFMRKGFDKMLNGTDETLGYPHDSNRLVQRWAWFSLDGATDDWGGSLFDVKTGTIRELGEIYRDYTSALTGTISLHSAQMETSPSVQWATGEPVTFTLKSDIANSGNISTTSPITVAFYEGDFQNPGPQIGEPQLITQSLAGCGGYTAVAVTWTNVLTGSNPYFVQIESPDDPLAVTKIQSGVALVATRAVYLPLVLSN